MTRTIGFLLAAFFLGMLTVAGAGTGKKNPAKKIFLKNRCNECHSILSEKIGKKEDDNVDDELTEEEGEEEVDPPDLSDIGTKKDAEWMQKWLRKKVKLDGHKHKRRFKGSKKDLKVLTEWLETLKTPVKVPEKSKKK